MDHCSLVASDCNASPKLQAGFFDHGDISSADIATALLLSVVRTSENPPTAAKELHVDAAKVYCCIVINQAASSFCSLPFFFHKSYSMKKMWQTSQLLLLLSWKGFKRKMRKTWTKTSHHVSFSFLQLNLLNHIVCIYMNNVDVMFY